jgi:hypothetical protein
MVDLAKQDELKRQQNDKIDKWMQTLVIPLILAIITAFISDQTDIKNVIAYAFALLATLGLIYAFIWIARSVIGMLNYNKREDIQCCIDDLQSVLDVVFVFEISNVVDIN